MSASFRARPDYIPTLDGWRAVAIVGVMLFHGGMLFAGWPLLEATRAMGEDGVRLFFAISGILICSRLLDEEEKSGGISLRSFYLRRLFRIQPAAFVFLGAVALLGLVRVIPFHAAGWWAAVFSARNFVVSTGSNDGAVYTSHFWSLAIEEQFYLMLPWLLILIPKVRRIAVMGVLTLLGMAWYDYLAGGTPSGYHRLRTESEMCWLLLPSLLALLMRRPGFRAGCVRYLQVLPIAVVSLLVLAGIVLKVKHVHHLWLPCLPFLVYATILHPQSWLSRFLELAPLRFVGRISYSVYLWQQLFCLSIPPLTPAGWPLGWLQRHPVSYVAPFVFALASYYLVERPMIRVGHRVAGRGAAASAAPAERPGPESMAA